MINLIFYFFAFLAIAAALYAVSAKQIIRSVFAMFACFFAISGLLVFAQSDFIAIAHLMIYVGGILVVMVFGIMLSQKASLSNVVLQKKSISLHQYLALLACVALFVILMYFFYLYGPNTPIHYVGSDIEIIGIALLTKYLLPFELVSLLLLAAFIFTAMVTRKNKN